MFKNIYKGKKVLITGNTGFKGSWLTFWLLRLGAEIVGYSNDIPTEPSLYVELKLEQKIKQNFLDIRNLPALEKVISNERPDFIFHLAAQPIVSTSFKNPIETIQTNTMGTANVLEASSKLSNKCVLILITSDKCYENMEWVWGYREDDRLGGKDIYSASKGAAEIIISAYVRTFFNKKDNKILVGVGRAGNVIGGGDWALDRLVVDIVNNWQNGKDVLIRNPDSTRPWQHVLEPLSGYLTLGAHLFLDSNLSGEAFNFGPNSNQDRSVKDLVHAMQKIWHGETDVDMYLQDEKAALGEASLLKLNCDKAIAKLKWRATLDFDNLISFVVNWYKSFYSGKENAETLTDAQIDLYCSIAKENNIHWSLP